MQKEIWYNIRILIINHYLRPGHLNLLSHSKINVYKGNLIEKMKQVIKGQIVVKLGKGQMLGNCYKHKKKNCCLNQSLKEV